MSQVPDWNAPGSGQPTPPPQYGQAYQQAPVGQQPPQYGQPQPQYGQSQAMLPAAPGYGMPGMAVPIPQGMYQDQLSGLILPNGTVLAPVGRRIGAFFLGILLDIVTLGIGYIIWGAITWSDGQSPVQQVLGLQCWKPQERVNASWGTMFLRGLGFVIAGWIPFAQIVSFFLFVSGKEHRALHDSVASIVVLHDPNKVLKPVRPA
jgi:hypothetical protein